MMLLLFKIIALSGYDVNGLKIYMVSKISISCDTSCIVYYFTYSGIDNDGASQSHRQSLLSLHMTKSL